MPETSTQLPRFLAALDSIERREADTPRTAAELQFCLLFGQRVLLSQTQAFDGKHFLSLASGKQAEPFLNLIKNGHLLIHLQPDNDPATKPSLCKLLATKTAQSDFHLSGWPEIPQPHPDGPKEKFEERQLYAHIFADALRGNAHGLSQLDDKVASRWWALRQIDASLADTPSDKRHSVSSLINGRTLDDEVHALAQTPFVSPNVRAQLLQTALKETNARSCYHKDITRAEGLNRTEKIEAHQLVNGEYNRVVAHSLAASPNLLVHTPEAVNALQATAARSGWTQRGIEEAPDYAGQVEGLSWQTLGCLLRHLENTTKSLEDRSRFVNEQIRYAAEEVTDHEGKRKIKVVLGNVLASELIAIPAGEAVKAATAAVMHAVPYAFTIPHDALLLSQPVAMAIIGYLNGRELGIKSLAKDYLKTKSARRHTDEIVNLVKHHPNYPHTDTA